MALTNALRQPLGVELPGSPRARRFWAQLTRARAGARELPVTIRSNDPFEPQIPQAAAAERLVEEDADGVTWWLRMPGAGRDNTEVVWDPARCKLSVGAWSGRVPRGDDGDGSRGRLLWHTSMWQPGVDGARATAAISRGWVGVRLPHRPEPELGASSRGRRSRSPELRKDIGARLALLENANRSALRSERGGPRPGWSAHVQPAARGGRLVAPAQMQ